MAHTETFHNMGFRLNFPDVFDHPRGLLSPMPIGDMGDGIYFMMYNYIAMSAEDLKALKTKTPDGEMSEEDKLKVADLMGTLLVVLGADKELGPKEIAAKLGIQDPASERFIEVGRYKDLVYYANNNPGVDERFKQVMSPEFAQEYDTLQAALIEALKNAEYIGPQIAGEALIGKKLQFVSKDIDGNPVKSEDIFSAHAVTMINFWATWCGPCKKELEELGNIHRRLQAKNAAVIGVCDDAAEKADECRTLIRDNHLTYMNILPFAGAEELEVEAFPTTFFVDNEGKIMTYPIIGVPGDISDYEKTVDRLLGLETEAEEPAETGAGEEKKNTCRVIVTDEEGDPVAGAGVQFCSNTTCVPGKTDEEGIASFSAEKGQYTVHVQKVPEGYEKCTEEFAVPQDFADVKIVLKKA